MPEFRYEGLRIAYDEYGSGDRPLILIHGLLMNRRMFDRLAPEIAERGNRVITVDLLGHGQSDRPEDLVRYSMPLFARQVVALLDHLELDEAVIGGTSLGANVALQVGTRHPERVRGMVIEMPVLDNALAAVAMIFTPVMLALRFGRPLFEVGAVGAKLIPRSHYLVDIGLDWMRQRPGPSLSVLEGLLLGETAPHPEERRKMEQPAMIVGHPGEPLHPFSDSDMLAAEMRNSRLVEADSILEWRLKPERLDDELSMFLDEVWAPKAVKSVPGARAAAGGGS
jgi:pimeloyl-ACP methyl ester carboxylesterase